MGESKEIKSDELGTSLKTGGNFFDIQKEGTTQRKDSKEKGVDLISEEDDSSRKDGRLTPLEASQKRYYESEKKKNDAKTGFFNVLKFSIPIFVSIIIGLLAFFGGIWAYKLNNIAEPIGGLKVEVNYIKETIIELKAEIKTLQEKAMRQAEVNINGQK